MAGDRAMRCRATAPEPAMHERKAFSAQPEILGNAPRCGARTRCGAACRSPAVRGNRRCRMHGGRGSGAPRGNRNAWKHGLKSARIREIARYLRATSPSAIRRMVNAALSPHRASPSTAHPREPLSPPLETGFRLRPTPPQGERQGERVSGRDIYDPRQTENFAHQPHAPGYRRASIVRLGPGGGASGRFMASASGRVEARRGGSALARRFALP